MKWKITLIRKKKRFRNCRIVSDPQGSYTGRPLDEAYEIPVQDADDL